MQVASVFRASITKSCALLATAFYSRRRDICRPSGRRFAKLDLGKISNRPCVVTQFSSGEEASRFQRGTSSAISSARFFEIGASQFGVRSTMRHRFWFPSESRDVRRDIVLFESRVEYPRRATPSSSPHLFPISSLPVSTTIPYDGRFSS